jgi:hypothetical protein
MLTRRLFLSHATTTLALIPIVAAVGFANSGCSSSGTTSPATAPPVDSGGGPATSGDITTLSTVASDPTGPHQHSMTIVAGDINSPPAAGVTETSTTMNNHSHTVTLTSAQLAAVHAGQAVTVTSSSTGHTHDFTVKMA